MLISAGIDDLGTEKQLLQGWSYFIIEENLMNEFSQETIELLRGIALDSFHGKNYKKRFKGKYLQFLRLCREYAEKSNISLISVILQNQIWKEQYLSTIERIIENAYGQNDILDDELVSSTQMLAGPLFTLQSLTKSLSSENRIQVFVDSHNVTKGFLTKTIQVKREMVTVTMTSNQLLNVIYNGYRERIFPNSPKLVTNGISVELDGNSPLIQAADIMGNFSLSYVKKN